MKSSPFWLLLIVLIGVSLHLFAIRGGHFYFTVDQGRDAVYARDIVHLNSFPLKGPETTIRGIFIGPLWYYLTALGLILTKMNPIGVVYLMIVLNCLFSIWLYIFLAKKIGNFKAGAIITTLQFQWNFFESSLWGFNPFPAVPIAIIIISLLSVKKILPSLLLTLLLFNFELAAFVPIMITVLISRPEGSFERRFAINTIVLLLTSTLIFTLSNYYRSWHSAFLPPLVFTALSLIFLASKRKVFYLFIAVLWALTLFDFSNRYQNYLKSATDNGFYNNQIAVVDWIYQDASGQGFNVYDYTPTFYDYPYQYHFWEYGLRKYGYLPQEYANYPLAHKELYVANYQEYLEPRRTADRLTYLIIDGATNGEKNEDWIDKFRTYHDLKGSTKVGNILIEKYERRIGSPDDFCIWHKECH